MELKPNVMARVGLGVDLLMRTACARTRRCRWAGTAWAAIALIAAASLPAAAQTNADPRVASEPLSGLAAVGESFGFRVTAGGTAPFAYQWFFNSTAITNATGPDLTLTNLTTTNAGNYSVVITNNLGGATSAVALLFVVTNAPRYVSFGSVSSPDASSVRVPLFLSGNGREASVRFTLVYSTNAFASPVFEPENPAWSVSASNSVVTGTTNSGGHLAVGLSPAPPGTFAASNQPIGRVTFQIIGTNTPFTGYLNFTNTAAFDTNGLQMLLDPFILPQADVVDPVPWLNRQTGLFRQRVMVGNASGLSFTNLEVITSSPGYDSLSNLISHYNAHGSFLSDLNRDGTNEIVSYVPVGPVSPGTRRLFTMEFNVPDHKTAPAVTYSVAFSPGRSGSVLPLALTPVPITVARSTTNGFLIEFPTKAGFAYYVLYSSNVLDLTNSAAIKIAVPIVGGTGSSRQWIDVGPPRTPGPVTEGERFYRVVEAQ